MINHHHNNTSQQIILPNTMKRDNQFSLLFSGFVFGKKNERINWRKIASVDLDRVSREVDVDVLQDNIEQLTFCNIESEIDSRMIDPNFIKLFKMSQLTIEYLLECQRQLVEYISNSKGQIDESYSEINELRKINEVLQKELTELKKENKRRKKMIEIQQNMINSNSNNYHRCAYCSKAFLNIMYLQQHMARRHSQMPQVLPQQQQQQNKISPEIEAELEKIKEKLRETENQLSHERNARFTTNPNDMFKEDALLKKFEEWKEAQKKSHSNDMKSMEEKFLKEIDELRMKNAYSERALNEFEKKLGKHSNVGTMEDEVDEAFLRQQQEYARLKNKLELNKADFSKQYDDVNSKWRSKINKNKEKYERELDEKDAIIAKLNAKLVNSKKHDDSKRVVEKEELHPPPVTPRISGRSPSPTKSLVPQAIVQSNLSSRSSVHVDMYLPDYCPLTKNALKTNPNMLASHRETVKKMFYSQLDDIGIYPDDKGLTNNDFKMKMNELEVYRRNIHDDIKPYFNQMRKTFAELCNEHYKKRFTSSLKSSNEYRVKFQKDPIQYNLDEPKQHHNKRPNVIANKLLESISHDKSTSEMSEVSVPNAVESNDDDTEPTRPFSNPILSGVMNNSQNKQENINKNNNTKQQQSQHKAYYEDEDDEISDLESNDKKNNNNKIISNSNNNSNVKKNIGLIEKQLEDIKKKGTKPTSNAVPTAFKSASPYKNKDDDVSDVTVSSLEGYEDEKAPKQKMTHNHQPSLDTSTNTSIWASVSHGANHQANSNGRNVNRNDGERPATANSIPTSNYDSDDYLE